MANSRLLRVSLDVLTALLSVAVVAAWIVGQSATEVATAGPRRVVDYSLMSRFGPIVGVDGVDRIIEEYSALPPSKLAAESRLVHTELDTIEKELPLLLLEHGQAVVAEAVLEGEVGGLRFEPTGAVGGIPKFEGPLVYYHDTRSSPSTRWLIHVPYESYGDYWDLKCRAAALDMLSRRGGLVQRSGDNCTSARH
jgi:hypothetical protein